MSKSTTMMGTACVLAMAAITAGPAAAAPLTDFAGTLTTNFGMWDDDSPGSDSVKSWLLGGSVAAPLPDLANLNVQFDASYRHNWADNFSQEDWNLGGSLFWASMDGRVGVNFNHATFTSVGHVTNGGVFGEWYLGNLTAMGKAGWLSSGGSGFGGHGNYLGAALAGYITPDLAITGGVEWGDLVQGQGCQTCGRQDLRVNAYELMAEWLFSPAMGLSGYAGYTFVDSKIYTFDSEANIWLIGLRWYTGGGALVDRHRNGNLNPWLPALGGFNNF